MMVILLAAALAGCGNNYSTNPIDPTPGVVVAVGIPSWNPATITIKAGDVVTFRNDSSTLHNVQFDQTEAGAPANAPNFASTAKDVTFATAGMYAFHCGIHPNMQGHVIVTP